MLLFTTKRVIFVDMQGFFGLGKKVEYTSIPWTTVTAFSARTAGSFLDKDSGSSLGSFCYKITTTQLIFYSLVCIEMCLWLDFDDVFNPKRDNEDDPPPPPIPRKSLLEVDFQKDKVDTLVIHRYLSERLMRVDGHQLKPFTSTVSPDLLAPSPPQAMQNVFDWIGDNAAAIDAQAVDEKFHEAGLFQEDERCTFAFKSGRDSLYLTNKRLFVIDVQASVKVSYVSNFRVICISLCDLNACRGLVGSGRSTSVFHWMLFARGPSRAQAASTETWK